MNIPQSIEKIIGTVAIAMIVFGYLFKLMHFPLSGILLIMGHGSMATLSFMGYQMFFADKKANFNVPMISFAAGVSMAILYIANLFQMMNWPSSGSMKIIALPAIIIAAGMAFYIRRLSKGEDDRGATYSKNLLFRIALAVFVYFVF